MSFVVISILGCKKKLSVLLTEVVGLLSIQLFGARVRRVLQVLHWCITSNVNPGLRNPLPPGRQKVQKVFNRFEVTNPPQIICLIVVHGCISPECFKWSGLIWGWSPWLADFKMGGSSWAGFSAYLYWPGGKFARIQNFFVLLDVWHMQVIQQLQSQSKTLQAGLDLTR